jgi:dolichol-phosphate mannosyltransferase
MQQDAGFYSILALRERYRDDYWQKKDPIIIDRLLWRAQTFRHIVHLLPGETILELGCGKCWFTRALQTVTRGENPITAVRFNVDAHWPPDAPDQAKVLGPSELPGLLTSQKFDYVVAMDLVDGRDASQLLTIVYELLAPSGELVFYESNPSNPVYKIHRILSRFASDSDPRNLLSRDALCETVLKTGFIQVNAFYNDFVYAPLTRRLIWLLRNLSILLENAPGLQKMAGSILLHAQKGPSRQNVPARPSFIHESLRDEVSFVIPCHNEQMNIRPLVQRILDLYGPCVHEIILVNDGSSDGTATIINELATKHECVKPVHRNPPNGVGRAIAEGLPKASGRYVLTMDCDFQHLLPEFRDLFDAIVEGYDVVVGSRFSRHSVLLNYPFSKIVANRGFHLLARLLLLRSFRDLTNNLKLMHRQVVQDLELRQPGFAVNAETGLQPLIIGYRIKEVPISWINRFPGMGASSFHLLRAGGGYWRVLFNIWVKQLFGAGPYRNLRRHHD